jgi:uncharacterized membrane protein YcaP (DUF421 family)
MYQMLYPWWEFIVRAAVVYFILLILVRLSGKRTVGQFTPFDLLVVMLLSEGVSNSLSGGDESLLGGLIVAATLVLLNVVLAFATSRNKNLAEFVEGTPTLLGRNGEIFHSVLKKCRIPVGDVQQALREADCKLEDMKCIFLEVDGKITILFR